MEATTPHSTVQTAPGILLRALKLVWMHLEAPFDRGDRVVIDAQDPNGEFHSYHGDTGTVVEVVADRNGHSPAWLVGVWIDSAGLKGIPTSPIPARPTDLRPLEE